MMIEIQKLCLPICLSACLLVQYVEQRVLHQYMLRRRLLTCGLNGSCGDGVQRSVACYELQSRKRKTFASLAATSVRIPL